MSLKFSANEYVSTNAYKKNLADQEVPVRFSIGSDKTGRSNQDLDQAGQSSRRGLNSDHE